MQDSLVTRLLVGGTAAAVLAFLMLPMLAVIPLSFSSTELMTFPPPGFSLRWYQEFFTSGRWVLATQNSLIVAFWTTTVATVLGTLAALGLQLGRLPGKAVMLAVLTMPTVTPSIVIAAAMFFAYSRIGLTGSLVGLVLAHTVIAVPFVVLSVLASLQTFDQNLIKAAASLGAAPHVAFARVVMPLIAPGIGTGAIFAFATSFDEFVITLFMAGPGQFTLPRQMYASVREFLSPTICAAAVMLFLCSLVLLVGTELLRVAAERRGGAKIGPA